MIRIASIRKTCLKKFWGMSYPKCTLKVKTVTACSGRDCNEWIWFWRHERKTRKFQD